MFDCASPPLFPLSVDLKLLDIKIASIDCSNTSLNPCFVTADVSIYSQQPNLFESSNPSCVDTPSPSFLKSNFNPTKIV